MQGQGQKLTDQDATYHFVKLSNNESQLIGKVEVLELLVIAPIGEMSCLIRASDPFRRISCIRIEALGVNTTATCKGPVLNPSVGDGLGGGEARRRNTS